jgi:hypothetical protein
MNEDSNGRSTDDPIDDCSGVEVLTKWITPQKKNVSD